MEVKIARRAPLRVAFMRHVGPYSAVGKTWDRFLPVLGKEGLLGGDTQFIGLCHDDPEVTPPSRVRHDACVSVDERFSPTGEIGVQVLAGGEYAVTTHFGPYDQECLTIARIRLLLVFDGEDGTLCDRVRMAATSNACNCSRRAPGPL